MRADAPALARRAFRVVAGLVLIGVSFPGVARAAEPIKGDATFSAAGGYARLVLKLAEDVESEVVTAGSIIVIRFKRRWTSRSINCPTRCPTMSDRRGAIRMAWRSGCRWRAG